MKASTRLLMLPALAGLIAVSCQQEKLTPSDASRSGIRFSNVKETFTEGTRFGLFAGEPINRANVKLTVNAQGQLTPEDSIFWGAGQKTSSSFVCYTPYNETYTGGTVSFSVNEDQSTATGINASDLMCAVSSAAPSDGAVNFQFKHKMATALLWFDNRTGSEITKVELNDICTACTFSLSSGEVASPSESKTIICYKADGYWQAVFVPQTTVLSVKVTLANGKTYVRETSRATEFASGSKYSTDQNKIVIEDDTPKALTLVFSVSDWADGGQLNFNGEEGVEYTTLAQLAATAGSKASSFDGVKVKDVIVTKVYGSNAHIEDSTAALLVYTSGHKLVEGYCITGEISGTIQLYDGNRSVQDEEKAYAELTAIDFSKASVTTVSEDRYPLTTITIAEYQADCRRYFNRRVLFKDVTVETGISSSTQTGTISQAGRTLTIFNKSKEAQIEAGLAGDLICFTTAHKSTLQGLVYTTDQFTEGGSAEAEDTPFTRLTLPGVYSATDTDSPTAVRAYEAGSDQTSCSKGSSFRGWNIFNLRTGSFVQVSLPVSSVITGATVVANVNINGTVSSDSVKVVKKTGTNAWLENKTSRTGYVISLQ